MRIHLDISESYLSQFETRIIEKAALAAFQHQEAPQNAEISIVIASDEQLHDLNFQFRELDAPTDVLSFPSEFTDPESGASYLGDVVISFPQAKAQSQTGGHTIEDELQLLVVHGVLHLLGHNHAEPLEKSQMWAAQVEILETLGIGNISLPE
ncbi:MAG: rRNA maturation RNase YbeY [Anaerolineales bacterium]|nr:rRNA maturation RNase YbeY [Chloroflexota bacterium]MBL6982153.1 rRNA maturation RNase YbeY [Anaerolineales bacterium]